MLHKRLVWAAGLATLLLLLLFFLRNPLLHYSFRKVQVSLLEKYGLQLSATNIYYSGIDNVHIHDLTLQPINADTLLSIKNMRFDISILDLAQGQVAFNEIAGDSIFVSIFHSSKRNNSRFSSKESGMHESKSGNDVGRNFYDLAERIQGQLLLLFNTNFDFRELNILYADSLLSDHIYIPVVSYNSELLVGKLINKNTRDTILFEGEALKKNREYQLIVIHPSGNKNYFPLSGSELGLKYGFDTLTATLIFEKSKQHVSVATDVTVKNLGVNHWRLAKEDVVLPATSLKGILRCTSNSIELDSASYVLIKNTKANLFANFTSDPSAAFTCSLKMPETTADAFFRSLPEGIFSTLKGISCTGSLSYSLFFCLPLQQPDSVVFESKLSRKNFSIRQFGVESFARVNGPFTYEAYDKDHLVRLIEVSPANPTFTPLNRISPVLVNAVLQSEDPSFMQHQGFLPEAFRESIIKNYKEKRFARGGSTISMQLVKNVFLSRNKTISRKMEEALIVYLIENLGLVSKERMLEVYLNVIEWGPNVYGIGEASRFYFNKKPSDLNLQESIFLAGIIPAPKYFKYQFDKQGQLRNSLSNYFRILSGRMVQKGWIAPSDTINLVPNVKLKGPALRMVVPNDTLLLDFTNEDLIHGQ